MQDIRAEFKGHQLDDQLILKSVNVTHPSLVNVLPDGFDITLTHRWRKVNFPYDKVYPKTFMLHHNGNLKNSVYWNRTEWTSMHPDSWGLMLYYVNLPWSWARYFAESEVRYGSSGHLIRIVGDPDPEWLGYSTNLG